MLKINKKFLILLSITIITGFVYLFFIFINTLLDPVEAEENKQINDSTHFFAAHKEQEKCPVNYTFEYDINLDSRLAFLNDYNLSEGIDSSSSIIHIYPKASDPNSANFESISIRCIDPSIEFFDDRDYVQYIMDDPLVSTEHIPFFDTQATKYIDAVRQEKYDKMGTSTHYYILNKNGLVYHYTISNEIFWQNNEMLISLTK